MLSACKEATPIDQASFKSLWEESRNHSAVSWWYAGESEDYYLIIEKWPAKSNLYKVSKHAITIKGIPQFQGNSGNKPINLKNHNIVLTKPTHNKLFVCDSRMYCALSPHPQLYCYKLL